MNDTEHRCFKLGLESECSREAWMTDIIRARDPRWGEEFYFKPFYYQIRLCIEGTELTVSVDMAGDDRVRAKTIKYT